jgi:regulation of enolase protein 1 (concanavalin A-like superfamily)
MKTSKFLTLIGLAAMTALPVGSSARAASVSAVPAPNQLYLVISNSPTAVYLTAFNTVSNVSYEIQTNTDITNPSGWGVWVTLLATNNVTPLSSLGLDFREIYFRAIVQPLTGGETSSNAPNSLYLGRLDTNPNADQSAHTNQLVSGHNQSVSDENLPGWGRIINPDGDCSFYLGKNSLVISVPGSGNPHDLAAEINRTNAPRVLQDVEGDFTIQVQTDGRYEPGEISTQENRSAYNGAAIIVTLDPQNVVTMARAVLQFPGDKPGYYANFEMRSGGKLRRMGLTGDHGLPSRGPVFLRLQRSGLEITGAVSLDGSNWQILGTKKLSTAWSGKVSAGVAAISTSEAEFDPRFSGLTISR